MTHYVHIKRIDSELELSRTNLNVTRAYRIGCKYEEQDELDVGVLYITMNDVCKLYDGVVTLSPEMATNYIGDEQVCLTTTNEQTTTRFWTLDAKEFPPMYNGTLQDVCAIDGTELATAISKVYPAVGDSIVRPALGNIYIEYIDDNQLRVWATDGCMYIEQIIPGRHRSSGTIIPLPGKAIKNLATSLKGTKYRMSWGDCDLTKEKFNRSIVVNLHSNDGERLSIISQLETALSKTISLNRLEFDKLVICGSVLITPTDRQLTPTKLLKAFGRKSKVTLAIQNAAVSFIGERTNIKWSSVYNTGNGKIKLNTQRFVNCWKAMNGECVITFNKHTLIMKSENAIAWIASTA